MLEGPALARFAVMSDVAGRLVHYFEREMAERAHRPLGDERERRLADRSTPPPSTRAGA